MTGTTSRAVIMVVSRIDAVEVALRTLRPEVAGLIASQDIVGPVAAKCEEFKSQVLFRYRLVDSPMEIGDSFERFEHLLSELEGLGYGAGDVVLDASGGTTPMRFGAALAAMTRGIRMVHQRVPQDYVDGQWVVDASKPREVVPMDNPLESTGLLREGQAIELFNRRDYGAAALVFRDVVAKVTGIERRHYYGGLLLLAEGYGAWDVADYGVALDKLRAAREGLAAGFAEATLAERAGALAGRISVHLSFLGKVRGKLSVEKVVDMLENARRRIVDQGRYDDGVARLYRAVEMWHQWRLLSKHSVSTDGVRWDKVSEEAKQRFLAAEGLNRLPELLDLRRARTLDRVLTGEVQQDDNVLRDLLQQRNRSILAHGLSPIGATSAATFLDYVDVMVGEPEKRAAAEHAKLQEL
ncbi:MAG: TIGR02710 family CRISPR-associated CARF protein [Actinomycetota bacterium]|nr:TIGR02710 family CRISPR-associated CARF protein [Actinomycetota bacterium]